MEEFIMTSLTQRQMDQFAESLTVKGSATKEKYLQDVRAFCAFLDGRPLSQKLTIRYRETLLEHGYSARSVNSILASLNSLFRFLGREDCRAKNVKIPRKPPVSHSTELSWQEYERLLNAAKPRLRLIMETIAHTGIRISELKSFTVETVRAGGMIVSHKSRDRFVLIPEELQKRLLAYAEDEGIASGAVFRTGKGSVVNRSNVWSEMKRLCGTAGVDPAKVFPRSLCRLFFGTSTLEENMANIAELLNRIRMEHVELSRSS